MNEPQEKMLVEQPPEPKANSNGAPIGTVSPIVLGFSIAAASGLGPGIYKAIGETTGWGTYTIATFCVGTILMGVIGGLFGGVAQMVADSFGKEVKS